METLNHHSIKKITTHFAALSSMVPLHTIRTKRDYDKAVEILNQLLDIGAANEKHPLAGLVDTLGVLIGEYDEDHYPAKKISPAAMLKFLMKQRHLKQVDLREIGTQGVVSEILNGKRNLNARQIKALCARFNVSSSVFM